VANRSYLYSTHCLPGEEGCETAARIGLSEWAYDIPLVYKLLVSGRPRVCPSSIWESDEDIAIAGDYAEGVARLKRFLARIDVPSAQPMIQETLAFLDDPGNVSTWIVLESREIFEMQGDDLGAQNQDLLVEIADAGAEEEDVIAALHAPAAEPHGLLGKLFGPSHDELSGDLHPEVLDDIGLGAWTNDLYFDLSLTAELPGDDGLRSGPLREIG
jgi:hypothetical protein